MFTPRQDLGLRGLGIFSASLLLFSFLVIAIIQGTSAVKAAVPPSLPTEASWAGVPKSHADIPACNPDWIAVASPDPGIGVATLNGVAVVSSDDAWAVGSYENSSHYQTRREHK